MILIIKHSTQRVFQLIICLVILFSVVSCQQESKESVPDVDHIKVDFDFIDFDKKIQEMDGENVDEKLALLIKMYPEFSKIFFSNVLNIPKDSIANELLNYNADSRIQFLRDTTRQILGSLEDVKADFEQAFKYYAYYFPENEAPNVYTFISEYVYQRFIFRENENNDAIGIGLDMFLGHGYPYQTIIPNNPAFSAYMTRSFNKDHMVKKSIETLVEDLLGTPSASNTLLAQMIRNGKKLYILDKLMPFVSDTVIMEYSAKQLKWCENNEVEMWAYLFSKDLFYSTDYKEINKLVNPSPHSTGMPDEAPGRTANFMGWQIVKAYMKKHPDLSLENLINEFNEQKILELSKYKP